MSSAWGLSFGLNWGNSWGSIESAPINANATTDSINNYEICERTGFKVKPGTLVKEWSGLWVRPDSIEPRNAQDFLRSIPERQQGAERPEQDGIFILTDITPDDL